MIDLTGVDQLLQRLANLRVCVSEEAKRQLRIATFGELEVVAHLRRETLPADVLDLIDAKPSDNPVGDAPRPIDVDGDLLTDVRHFLIDENQPSPSPQALKSHRVHIAIAKRKFRRQEDLQLKPAAELSREFRTARASELYGLRLAVESTRHTAELLKETLEGAGTHSTRQRL
jgi:hypothetical protein